jgi:NodT family efflux transporter outer membrane factor (OMF) lipoprotein
MTAFQKHTLPLLAGCFLISACTPFTMPSEKLSAPAHWQETASMHPAENLSSWWQRFNDPQLNALITLALQSNLDLKQAQARIEQARAELSASSSALYPSLDFNTSITRSDNGNSATSTNSSFSNKPSTLYRTGFDASWELDWLGRTRTQIAAAQARHAASIEDLRDAQVTLLADVANTYITLRNSQRQRVLAQENIDAQKNIFALTQERYRRGLVAYLDVAEAQTELAAAQATLPLYSAQEKQAQRAIAVLLGYAPEHMPVALTPITVIPTLNAETAIGLPSDLLTRRPDLRAEQQRLVAAAADIHVAKLDRYPSLDLTFGLGLQSRERSTLFDIRSRYWSLAPSLQLPIFDAGRIRANINNKQAVYDEARYRYQQTFNRALQDVENALTGFYAEDARCEHLQQAVTSATEAVTLAQQRYATGLDNFLNVIVAQRALYSAQSNLADAKAQRSTQAIALYKALGGGWQ